MLIKLLAQQVDIDPFDEGFRHTQFMTVHSAFISATSWMHYVNPACAKMSVVVYVRLSGWGGRRS